MEQLPKLCKRLTQDTNSLEIQMDKVLQLSQLERHKELKTQEIDIAKYFSKKLSSEEFSHGEISVKLINNIANEQQSLAHVDLFALDLILRNLIENTERHSNNHHAKIELVRTSNYIQLIYTDGGKFQGNLKRVGELFSKGEKSKGSGIGLYLIKQLTIAMKGYTEFNFDPHFTVKLNFMAKGP